MRLFIGIAQLIIVIFISTSFNKRESKNRNVPIEKIRLYLIPFSIKYSHDVTPATIKKEAHLIVDIMYPQAPLDSLNHFYRIIDKSQVISIDSIETKSKKFEFIGVRMLAIFYPKGQKPLKVYFKSTQYFMFEKSIYSRNDTLLNELLFHLSEYYKPR